MANRTLWGELEDLWMRLRFRALYADDRSLLLRVLGWLISKWGALMDWYALRLRLSLWLKQSGPFHCIAKLLSKHVPEKEGFGKFGGGSTLERLHRAREIALTEGEESSEYFLDKCGAEAGDFKEHYMDAADVWWQQEIAMLCKVHGEGTAQRAQEERYKTWLVGACVAGVAVSFAIAMYAMRFL